MSCCNEMWHLGGPRHHHPPKCLNLPITSPHGNGTPDDNSPHFPECSACLATVDTNLPWDDFLAFSGKKKKKEVGSKDLGQHLGVFVMIREAFLKGFHHEGNALSARGVFLWKVCAKECDEWWWWEKVSQQSEALYGPAAAFNVIEHVSSHCFLCIQKTLRGTNLVDTSTRLDNGWFVVTFCAAKTVLIEKNDSVMPLH